MEVKEREGDLQCNLHFMNFYRISRFISLRQDSVTRPKLCCVGPCLSTSSSTWRLVMQLLKTLRVVIMWSLSHCSNTSAMDSNLNGSHLHTTLLEYPLLGVLPWKVNKFLFRTSRHFPFIWKPKAHQWAHDSSLLSQFYKF
jgi:hypothetical protein